jgi:hypothetical protein
MVSGRESSGDAVVRWSLIARLKFGCHCRGWIWIRHRLFILPCAVANREAGPKE